MTLYEINQALLNAVEGLEVGCDVETGEVVSDEEFKELIDGLQMTLSDKIENIGRYIKNLSADVDAFKSEQKKLMERRKVAENKLDRLQNYLDKFIKLQYTNLDTLEIDKEGLNKFKFETPSVKISYRKSASVEITDLSKVPSEYIKERVIEEDDIKKSDIKKLLQSDKDITVDYAKINENINLSVK